MTTALFIGDSITDAGRRTDPSDHLGAGYVRRVHEIASASQQGWRTVNRGIGGDRVGDLRRRWLEDCLALRPDILTVLVGINDVWRRYDAGLVVTDGEFADDYRWLLDTARQSLPDHRLVLMEPFLIPIDVEQEVWREEEFAGKLDVVRDLARQFDATLVPLHELLTRQAALHGAIAVAEDGVHPSADAHELIAQTWWAHTVSSHR